MEKIMKIIAVILAGGRSSRMKTPKSLLKIQGKPLIDKIYETLLQLKPLISEIVISGPVPGREFIADGTPFLGPVEGVKSVAEMYLKKADALLVVPVDLPLLDADSLRPLTDAFSRGSDTALTYTDHPLPAVFRLNERLLELCNQNNSVKGLLKNLNASSIELKNPIPFTNTNTPEEWAQVTGANL